MQHESRVTLTIIAMKIRNKAINPCENILYSVTCNDDMPAYMMKKQGALCAPNNKQTIG